jgi:hypothetical protein
MRIRYGATVCAVPRNLVASQDWTGFFTWLRNHPKAVKNHLWFPVMKKVSRKFEFNADQCIDWAVNPKDYKFVFLETKKYIGFIVEKSDIILSNVPFFSP